MIVRGRDIDRGIIPAAKIEEAYRGVFHLQSQHLCLGKRLIRKAIRLITGFVVGNPFHLADTYYEPVREGLIARILQEDKTNLEMYIAEDFDCDDFTFRLMGVFHQNTETAAMPIFITWVLTSPTVAHAVLSYYVDGKIKIIEPQSDGVYQVPEDWVLLLLCG